MLINEIQIDITKMIKKYNRNEYLELYKSDDLLGDGNDSIENENLEFLYPPVISSIEIINKNYNYLSNDNKISLFLFFFKIFNSLILEISIEILNSLKVQIFDFQYLIRKLTNLNKIFKKINEDIFIIRNLSHFLYKIKFLNELQPYKTFINILNDSKISLNANIVNIFTDDFNKFIHKQKEHNGMFITEGNNVESAIIEVK